jgi:hypothetical protein
VETVLTLHLRIAGRLARVGLGGCRNAKNEKPARENSQNPSRAFFMRCRLQRLLSLLINPISGMNAATNTSIVSMVSAVATPA